MAGRQPKHPHIESVYKQPLPGLALNAKGKIIDIMALFALRSAQVIKPGRAYRGLKRGSEELWC